MRLLVFLQNAWSPVYAGRRWPRESWLQALKESRTGLRLKSLIDSFDVCENTTPIVGRTPRSSPPADLPYMRSLLVLHSPQVIVGCGRQAEEALLAIWDGPLLCVPHPASRVVTTGLYRAARVYLSDHYIGRLALRQQREGWTIEHLRKGSSEDDPGQMYDVQSALRLEREALTQAGSVPDVPASAGQNDVSAAVPDQTHDTKE